MSHLGERVCDLVDGQLAPEEVERAHVHLASCRPCRDLVEAERLTKARLAALAGPQPSADLVGSLLALGGPAGPVPPREGHVPGTPRPRTVAVGGSRAPGSASPSGRRPGGTARPARLPVAAAATVRPAAAAGARALRGTGRRARTVRIAAAVIGALGAVGAGVSALAATAPVGPATVVPAALNTFVVQHAGVTARLPILDVPAGWQLTRRGIAGPAREGGTSKR